MSECCHLTKTDRDAIKWALVQLGEMEKKEPESKQGAFPKEFEWLWKEYPDRDGGKGDKRKALQNCKARIKEGETWKSLARYMKAYQEHCKREGKIGTSFVMHFVTFFGPGERYKDDYSARVATGKSEEKSGFSAMVDRANSGELYQTTQDFYIAPNGLKYACMADYYAKKPPLEQ